VPEFRTEQGTPYFPEEERTADCPVASITPQSDQLLKLFARAARTHDASGAALFGPVLAEWPVWAVDALDTISICEMQESNARLEAQAAESRNR